MTREIKTYFAKVLKEKLNQFSVFEGHSKRTIVYDEEEDYRSYIVSDIKINVGKDGSISLVDCESTDGSVVYFYPEQLVHLKEALDVAMNVIDNKEKK